MPPQRTTASNASRAAPYTAPSHDSGDKENQAPTAQSKAGGTKSPKQNAKQSKTSRNIPADRPDDYKDVHLDEIAGEVPIYENAAAIRRKLNKLIETKASIPGCTKTFNKTTMAKEMQLIADRHHAFETRQGIENSGPTVQTLTRFLKNSGGMGGGDTKSYYLGHMLLEKMRIWSGEAKTAARKKAEAEFPNGRERSDPKNEHYLCAPSRGIMPPTLSEASNMGRVLD